MNEVKEDYNLVTETYDDYDRLIYKNYYRAVVPNIKRGKNTSYYPNNKKPKKLLYQDVYVYEGEKRIQSHIKRVYQPIIDISLAREGSENNIITATANFSCGSIILVSGFVWSSNQASLASLICRPPNFLIKSWGEGEGTPTFLRGTQKYLENNTSGQKVHSITEGGTVYFKAFAQIETGTLFSKTLSI